MPPQKPRNSEAAAPAPDNLSPVIREVIENRAHVEPRTDMPPAAFADKDRANEFRYANLKQVQSLANPREKRENNLPKPGKFSAMMEAAPTPDPAKAPTAKKWTMFGLQPPGEGRTGYTLHTWHYEGDVKTRETVRTNLTALGAREAAALQLAAFWAAFT